MSDRRRPATKPSTAPHGDPRRYVYSVRTRCPACRSLKLRTTKTRDEGDDVLTRWTLCKSCGWRFIVVAE